MNIANTPSIAGSTSSSSVNGDAVAISVLKKALQIQQQGAAQLISAVSQPQATANLNPNVGQNIDIQA